MTEARMEYPLADRMKDLFDRPHRFALWLILFGIAFAGGRLLFLLVLTIFAFARGIKLRKAGGGSLAWFTAIIAITFFFAHVISYSHSNKIEQFVDEHTPVDLALFPNGDYVGSGMGNNGEIKVQVSLENGEIQDVKLLSYRDAVYAFDGLIEKAKGMTSTNFAANSDFVFRSREALAGFTAAVNGALIPALPDYPKPGKLMRATFFLTKNNIGRITINTLAILFIVIISFDFFLQPTLSPGTGQSLNCYNCQACVGVCPVKMVAGDPFPMIMVLESRAGNYDRVAELAKYCVGCGKCASKCPVGNSGPSVASSSYLLWRDEIRREKRMEMAYLRGLNTLDQLSERDGDE